MFSCDSLNPGARPRWVSINPNVSAARWGNISVPTHTWHRCHHRGSKLGSMLKHVAIVATHTANTNKRNRNVWTNQSLDSPAPMQCNVECKLRGLVMIHVYYVDSLGIAHHPQYIQPIICKQDTIEDIPPCTWQCRDGSIGWQIIVILLPEQTCRQMVAWQGRCYVLWRGIKMCPGRCLFKSLATLVTRE